MSVCSRELGIVCYIYLEIAYYRELGIIVYTASAEKNDPLNLTNLTNPHKSPQIPTNPHKSPQVIQITTAQMANQFPQISNQ